MVIKQTSIDRFQKLLFKILSEYGGIDLSTLKRPKSSKLQWEEMNYVQKRRNQVIHRTESVKINESDQVLGVATYVLENLFPNLVEYLELHTHKDGSVCNKWSCKKEKIFDELKKRLATASKGTG